MKRFLAFTLSLVLVLSGCAVNDGRENETKAGEISMIPAEDTAAETERTPDVLDVKDSIPSVYGMNDLDLLVYLEDVVYAELDAQLDSAVYRVESVSAVFISQEYIDEMAYNSMSNVYFGYTLKELDDFFKGTRYVFTLGDDGTTTVKPLEAADDSMEATIIKNVAIGAGVILICAVISAVSPGASACAAIFAASAKTGTVMALSGAGIGAITAGTVKGLKTGDMDEALKAAALAGSEGFKWGAITGVVAGGASKTMEFVRANSKIPTPRQSEIDVLNKTKNAQEQVSFLNREKVPYATPNSTRPDVLVMNENNTFHAIEVKNYDLEHNMSTLLRELKREVQDRIVNLPYNSTQEIVLDIRGRHYEEALVKEVVNKIQTSLVDIYPDIPVSILG